MDGTLDTVSALGRGTVALVASGGLIVAALAFGTALAVAFCLGRLVERAVTQLRNHPRLPPAD